MVECCVENKKSQASKLRSRVSNFKARLPPDVTTSLNISDAKYYSQTKIVGGA